MFTIVSKEIGTWLAKGQGVGSYHTSMVQLPVGPLGVTVEMSLMAIIALRDRQTDRQTESGRETKSQSRREQDRERQ